MHLKLNCALTAPQLIGVTRGLDYLHNCGIVHGDIKSVRAVHPTMHPNQRAVFPVKCPH